MTRSKIQDCRVFFGGVLFISTLAVSFPAFSQIKPVDARIDSVLAMMTLEEKVGQMNQYNGFWDATGPQPTATDAAAKVRLLRAGGLGSVLNVQGPSQVRALQTVAGAETRLGIPLLFGSDVVHGYRTQFPIPLGEAASWDLNLMRRTARAAALEATADGLNWTFAPMVDVSRDPRWGRVMEGAGEDPWLGARAAEARVQGFQGADLPRGLKSPGALAACAKHFAGYGFVEGGRDYNTVDFSDYTLWNTVLPPFRAAADAGVSTFMNAFTTVNGTPATAHPELVPRILNDAWKFPGFVVSDWGSIVEMVAHGQAVDLRHASELAANAGCSMDMESSGYTQFLVELVRSGKVSESVVNDAVRRILRVKFSLGLMDAHYLQQFRGKSGNVAQGGSKGAKGRSTSTKRSAPAGASPAPENATALALEAAIKSFVLLENRSLLPLSTQKRVALVGPMAQEKNGPLGNWRAQATPNSAVSLEEGLRPLWQDRLVTRRGPVGWTGTEAFHAELAINSTDTSGWAAALRAAAQAEVAVVAVGEHGLLSGEGRSRALPNLPGLQEEFLRAVLRVQPRTVAVVFAGRPLLLPDDLRAQLGALLWVWQPGSQSGNAVAQVLSGQAQPQGRLPMTFPRSVGQIPTYAGQYTTGRPGPQAEVFWSHWTDLPNAPAYPFGYGLSYSTVEYGVPSAEVVSDATSKEQEVVFRVDLKNSGSVRTVETAQVYAALAPNGQGVSPGRRLVGFAQVVLDPGAVQTAEIRVSARDLARYSADGQELPLTGTHRAWVVPHAAASGESVTFKLP
jgi:beta-glucosidase